MDFIFLRLSNHYPLDEPETDTVHTLSSDGFLIKSNVGGNVKIIWFEIEVKVTH